MRLIDADALMKWANEHYDFEEFAVGYFIKIIQDIPTVDAVPVRHGWWIYTGQKNIYGGVGLKCSECGDNVMVQHIEDELYCRHCGAKMDAERKEE